VPYNLGDTLTHEVSGGGRCAVPVCWTPNIENCSSSSIKQDKCEDRGHHPCTLYVERLAT
jgi:hypothetical protein